MAYGVWSMWGTVLLTSTHDLLTLYCYIALVHLFICSYIHIFIYSYTYIHTYIHSYIHIRIGAGAKCAAGFPRERGRRGGCEDGCSHGVTVETAQDKRYTHYTLHLYIYTPIKPYYSIILCYYVTTY
jgi:hypothetical protein